MFYTSLDDVLASFVINRVQNFIVFQAGKEDNKMSNNCILNCTYEDDTPDQKRQNLIDTIKAYGNGDYIIKQCDGNAKNTCIRLRITDGKTTQPAQAVAVANVPNDSISRTELEAILAKKDSEFQMERLNDKLERMQKELGEAKAEAKKNSGALNEFFEKVTPFVAPVLQGLLSKRMPTAVGMLDNNEPQEQPLQAQQQETGGEVDIDLTEEEFNKVMEAITRWKELDPDWLAILCKLPDFVANPMYSTAKKFILK